LRSLTEFLTPAFINKEYHMPCEVGFLRVDFFKMAAVAMETAKMLKN
jgi:hypothetical protein